MIRVVEYNDERRQEWDEFVDGSNNGTIFHLQKFLDYHPRDRFENRHLLFEKRGRILSLLPAAEKETPEGKILVSHPGASYGGFVFNPNLGIRDAVAIIDEVLAYLKEREFKKLVLTTPPIVYHTVMNNYLDFALSVKGSRYLRRELSAVIETSEDPLPTFKPEARTAVRKSMKLGVNVLESDDYAVFYDILEKNLRMRHNVTPTHSRSEIKVLARLFPERMRLFAAYAGKEMIGGILFFICNSRTVLAFYISHIEKHQSMRPVNQLIYQVMKWSHERGHRYLDLGTFTLRMEPDFGLAKFKETFRARGVFRDTLEIDL